MDFRLLGPLEASENGQQVSLGAPKQRALLARLLLEPGRVVPVERLVDDLWGEEPPETAVKAVQIYVSKLRRVLPADILRTRAPGYALEADPEQIDLFRFERLLDQGRAALARGDARNARERLAEALSLWRGPALAEFREPFAASESARLDELRLACIEERVEAGLQLGCHGELVGELEALVGRHPLRERLRAQQLVALYRSGRQVDALAAYQAYRGRLAEELGLEPSHGLRELERRMLQQDRELEVGVNKGATAPVPSVAASPPAGRRRRPRPVGRDAELDRLGALLDDALSGQARLVFVSGEAGIGKTTLVEAFLAEAGDRDVLIGRGQCVEQHGAGEPYMPILDALGRLCRGPGGERVTVMLAERAPTWLVQMPGLVDADRLEVLQQNVLGATRERMLREMLETFEALTTDRPLLLALEDLHWSDPSTLDLLVALARRAVPGRLLAVGTYRPEDAGTGSDPVHAIVQELGMRGACTEIALAPLGERAVRAYLERRFPVSSFPDRLGRLLIERTAGNPLFIEAVVDAWVDGGFVARQAGEWLVDASLDELAACVPGSLRTLIEQRLERLDPVDREILTSASVAGRDFSAALVAAACGRDDGEVEARCDALARRGFFLAPRGEEEWPDRTLAARYGFAHDLSQEVIYAGLPAGRQARLHRGVGERLEAGYGDNAREIAAELAVHFVRGRDDARAVRYLGLAAEQALARSAPREAIEHLAAALDLLAGAAEDEERMRSELALQAMLGSALIGARGWGSADAERALLRVHELAERVDDAEELAWCLVKLGTVYEIRGEYVAAEELLERSLEVSQRVESPGLHVDSHELLACSLFHQGALSRTLEQTEQGLSLYDTRYASPRTAAYGDNAGVTCHSWAALALCLLGYPERARAEVWESIAVAEAARLAPARAAALVQAALVSQCALEHEPALEWADAALAVATATGSRYRHAMATVVRGWAVAAHGDVDAGVEQIRDGIGLSRAIGARMDDPHWLGMLADALLRAGRTEEASAAIEEAIDAVAVARGFFYEAELHRLRGVLRAREGDREEAEASLAKALETAHLQQARLLELRAAVTLARLRQTEDEHLDACGRVAAVYGWFTEGFDTPDLRDAKALLESVRSPERG